MLDPFPVAPPPFLVSAVKQVADPLNLHSLPLHAHEVLFAAALYTFTEKIVSPWLSALVCPNTYTRLSRRSKLNWDVHVVSFVQACIINGLSLYVIWFDEERKAWRDNAHWEDRIWGYYGSGGLCQSFALGYFLWDLYTCTTHVDIFGWGMLAHAISACAVFGLGYRPFIYFSAPIFLLYELSSPFLNIHWFCDKLNLTGSTYQAVNGVFLVGTFFCCRIVWGIYSSIWVFRDMYWAYKAGHNSFSLLVPKGQVYLMTTAELLAMSRDPQAQLTAFNKEQYTPIWIPLVYLASNLILNSLNVFWFGKMIETIRTRFDPPLGTKGLESNDQPPTKEYGDEKTPFRPRSQSIQQLNIEGGTVEEELDMHAEAAHEATHAMNKTSDGVTPGKGGSIRAARERAEQAVNGPIGVVEDSRFDKSAHDDGDSGADATGSARRSARSRRKA